MMMPSNLKRLKEVVNTDDNLEVIFSRLLNLLDLSEYLKEIAGNKNILNNLVNSYTHDNGFIKIPIYTVGDYKLRLHVWDSADNGDWSNIHNHRWECCSKIITGNYYYETYEICSDGEKHFSYEYLPDPSLSAYGFKLVGYENLKMVSDGERMTNEVYMIQQTEFHRIKPSSDFTATLFLSGPSLNYKTHVFSKQLLDTGIIPYRKIGLNDAYERIQQVIKST